MNARPAGTERCQTNSAAPKRPIRVHLGVVTQVLTTRPERADTWPWVPNACADPAGNRPPVTERPTGRYQATPERVIEPTTAEDGGPTRGQIEDREHAEGVPLSHYPAHEIPHRTALQEFPTERQNPA
jgi:hypothetical protein